MTNKKKVYSIPVIWQAWGVINVEADTLEAAKEKALDSSMPYKSEYIEDSMQIDEDSPMLRYQS